MIYFAQADGTDLVKIGFTSGSPAKRLAELQTGCPHRLTLLAAIEGSEQDEASWHKDFASDRVNGEWFKMSWRLCLAVARAEMTQTTAARVLEANPDRQQFLRLIRDCPLPWAAHLSKVTWARFTYNQDGRCTLLEIWFPGRDRESALASLASGCLYWLSRALVCSCNAIGQPGIEISTEGECLLQGDDVLTKTTFFDEM